MTILVGHCVRSPSRDRNGNTFEWLSVLSNYALDGRDPAFWFSIGDPEMGAFDVANGNPGESTSCGDGGN
jgi:hypothetical protein